LKIKTRGAPKRLSGTFYAGAGRAHRDEVPKSLVTDHNYIVSVKKLKVGMNVFIAGMGVCTYHGSDLLDGGFASGKECLSFSLYSDPSKRRMILPDRLENSGVRSLLPKKLMLETINTVLKSPRRATTVPERFKRDLDERIKSSDFSDIVSIVRDTRACSAFAEYWGIAAKALDMMADEYSLVMQVGKEVALQEITRLTPSSSQKPAKELSLG
jgi:RNA polymerase-interacting CarD/CdnL/TRCF family regulator